MSPVIAATGITAAVVAIGALAHPTHHEPDRIATAIAAYYAAPNPAIANMHRHDACNLTAGRTDLAPAAATFVKEHCP